MRSFAVACCFWFTSVGLASPNAMMGVIGDAGLAGQELNNLRDSLQINGIQSLILPGDNLYLGRYNWTWDAWKGLGFSFDVVAIGNHNGGYQAEMQYFKMPGEYFSTVQNKARFIVLNSDNENTVDEQCQWLESEIGRVSEKLVFLVYHHPTFDVGPNHSWRRKEKFQVCMREFLRRHGSRLTALLMGHEHITSLLDFGGVTAVVAGSGREATKANPLSYLDDGFAIQTKYLAPRRPFWVGLEINPSGDEARLHFVDVASQEQPCQARIKPGFMELHGRCAQADPSRSAFGLYSK